MFDPFKSWLSKSYIYIYVTASVTTCYSLRKIKRDISKVRVAASNVFFVLFFSENDRTNWTPLVGLPLFILVRTFCFYELFLFTIIFDGPRNNPPHTHTPTYLLERICEILISSEINQPIRWIVIMSSFTFFDAVLSGFNQFKSRFIQFIWS